MKTYFGTVLLLIAFALNACTSTGQTENQQSSLKVIDVEEAISLLEKEDVVLLDVRTPEEVSEGHIEGALHWDYFEWETFVANAETLDKAKPVMVYCKAGGRSNKTAKYLQSQGFVHVYDIDGGMNAWLAQNKPVTRN